MSKTASPHRFVDDMEHFYDPNFTADISQKMRVPKKIKLGGGDEVTAPSTVSVPDKFDMHVPDRILVVGQEQHVGTKAPPRELILENSIMPPDPGLIRVQTPPRVITLDEYSFPAADDAPSGIPDHSGGNFVSMSRPKHNFTSDQRLLPRGETPPVGAGGEGLTPAEEIQHLRKQMAKLNRRVMAIELDNLQRQQREKLLCALGLAYFFLKTVLWLSRSS